MKRREAKKEIEKIIAENIVEEQVYQLRPWTCYTAKSVVKGQVYHLLGFTKVRYPDEWEAAGGVERAKKKALSLCAKKIMLWFSAEYGIAPEVCPWGPMTTKWTNGVLSDKYYAFATAEMEKRYGFVRFDGHSKRLQ